VINVFEKDKLKSGTNQIGMEGENISVLIAPEVGGRIVGIQHGRRNLLHRTYPNGIDFGPYTEYGGIEECFGGAPGTLWNVPWIYEQRGRKNFKIVLSAYSRNILVKKSICLEDSEPIVNITYELLNIGKETAQISFGIHPEISMSGKFRESQYHIPTNGNVTSGKYTKPGEKKHLEPSHSWCALSYKDTIFAQFFPANINAIKVYYPMVDTHIVMEPIIYDLEIPRRKKAQFIYMLYAGVGDVETIRKIDSRRRKHKSIDFQPFKPVEVMQCGDCGILTTILHKSKIKGKVAQLCDECQAKLEAIPKKTPAKVKPKPAVARPVAKARTRKSKAMLEKEAVLSYYSRTDVENAMFEYARGRQLTTMRDFGTSRRFRLESPEEVLPVIKRLNKHKWPSIHGTVRRGSGRNRVWDIVFEADYKKDWSIAFESARPLVRMFLRLGIPFFVKYSGNSSPHIIIPGEVFKSHVKRFSELKGLYEGIYKFARKRMKRPSQLDMSFLTAPRHYLRLAYSIHEQAGKVSLPMNPDDYDSFTPDMAQIQNVVVIQDWWKIPEDARECGEELMSYLSKRK